MRELTNSYLFTKQLSDGTVIPLDGKIKVTNHNTTDLATLYSSTGVQIANPLIVANGHPSQQIFVNDVDVDVELLNEDNSHIFSYIDLSNASISGVTTQHLVGIKSVSDLRQLAVTAQSGISVILLGYYACGDKPALVYSLVNNSELSDDGGLCIASTVQNYYWVAKIEVACDVRHYGIFPENENSLPNISRTHWYFPYINALNCRYNIDGLTLRGAEFDNNVIIRAANTQAYIYDSNIHNVKLLGNITAYCDTIHSSSIGNGALGYPRKNFIIDNNMNAITTVNCDVIVTTEYNKAINLTNCNVYGKGGQITSSSQTLTNCKIYSNAIAIPSNPNYSGCTSEAKEWTSGNNFLKFMIINGNYDIDMQGNTLSAIQVGDDDITIRNAVLSNVQFPAMLSWVYFKNCNGTIYPTDEVAGIGFEDCNIEAMTNMEIVAPIINAINSDINGAIRCYSGSSFKNCSLHYGIDFFVDSNLEQTNITVESCDLNNQYIVFQNRRNLLPLVQAQPVIAGDSTTYVNNVSIKNNRNVLGSTDLPIYIVDKDIYQEHQGTYDVHNNGDFKETIIPRTGSRCIGVVFGNIGYDNSNHLIWANNILSIKALTFNFGENYNKNHYLGYGTAVTEPSYVKAQIHWKTGQSQSRKSNDSERKAVKIPNFWSSLNNESNISGNWTKVRNSYSGLKFSSDYTIQADCTDFYIVASWNQFGDEDFDSLNPLDNAS